MQYQSVDLQEFDISEKTPPIIIKKPLWAILREITYNV